MVFIIETRRVSVTEHSRSIENPTGFVKFCSRLNSFHTNIFFISTSTKQAKTFYKSILIISTILQLTLFKIAIEDDNIVERNQIFSNPTVNTLLVISYSLAVLGVMFYTYNFFHKKAQLQK